MQSEAESQYHELMSQSQADMSVSNEDEGAMEREIRELTQALLQYQQQLMSLQADYSRANADEEEALKTWEAKRSAFLAILQVARPIVKQ